MTETPTSGTHTPGPEPDDPRLDDYRGLRDPARRMAFEAGTGCFIAEGTAVVRRLLQSTLTVRSVLVLDGKQDRVRDLMTPGVPLLVTDRETLRGIAGFDVHRGVLACADRPVAPSVGDLATSSAASSRSSTLAVLEGLNDHENLGAIARSARALGVDGLVLDPTCADPWYRRAVRVSMGEVMFLAIARAERWPTDLAVLREAGFVLAALTPAAPSTSLGEFAARRPPRVALLLGAEGPGLSAGALAAADVHLRIPIRVGVDSLNVGHAAAIAFAALDDDGFGFGISARKSSESE